jgi:signal transduction histidine kinase
MNRGGNIEDRVALMDVMSQNAVQAAPPFSLSGEELEQLHQAYLHVLEQKKALEMRVRKEVGARTGLGLSITFSIIKEHRGTILVEKHEGEGAHFFIQLPRADYMLERE